MEKMLTPPPYRAPMDSKSRAEKSAYEVLAHNLNVIGGNLNTQMTHVNSQLKELRSEMKEEREERRREALSAKLWTGTLVTFATILGNIVIKFFH